MFVALEQRKRTLFGGDEKFPLSDVTKKEPITGILRQSPLPEGRPLLPFSQHHVLNPRVEQ